MANAHLPARTPEADTFRTGIPAPEIRVRRIGPSHLWASLRDGWDDFRALPTQLVFLGLIYAVIGMVAAYAASGRELMPLLWPLASGFALVGPVAAIGIYELSRRREGGSESTWLNAFDVLRSPNLGAILVVGLMLLAIFVAWLLVARALYAGAFPGGAPETLGAFLDSILHAPEGRRLMLLGNGIGFLFAVAVLALSAVSFPLMLDRPVGPGTAIRTSLRAVAVNPGPMALWGLIVALLLALGSLPLFVGLAVVMPVLGHATWHLYRRLIPR